MFDIRLILNILANKRPLFHSEADLKFSLAWQIKKQHPTSEIRLECPRNLERRIYLDIFFRLNDKKIAVELKYKTRRLKIRINDEEYFLKDQSGQDQGRYDFLKDMQRLETLVDKQDITQGYVVFLTNDSAYWKPPRSTNTVDSDFRIHDGRKLHGELRWRKKASKGTTIDRESPIQIQSSYHLKWRNYSELGSGAYNNIKYLSQRIDGGLDCG